MLWVLSGHPSAAVAQERAKGGLGFKLTESTQPIRIKSDQLEWDYKGSVVTFKGNVIAKQEGVDLYSDRLIMYLDGATNEVKQIVAEGAVKIVQSDRRATAEKAVFYNTEQKIILTGRPVVTQGKNVVVGERITILLDRDWVEVEKADVTISPEEGKETSGPSSAERGTKP
jgi:lipopolysaccharide export system protein LptA